MKTLKIIVLSFFILGLGACGSLSLLGGPSMQNQMDTKLKVSAGNGRLRAKLAFKNLGASELVLSEIDAKHFRVEMNGQPLVFKGENVFVQTPLKIPAGQTVETALNLEQSFPFKDRVTRYRVRFENSQVRSNDVQVWY